MKLLKILLIVLVSIAKDEAIEALVSLGYTPQDAWAALTTVDIKLPLEERVKQALKR